ncbi:MAG: serine protease [Verrucomicrobiota bacterium]
MKSWLNMSRARTAAILPLCALFLSCCSREEPASPPPDSSPKNAASAETKQKKPLPDPKESWAALPTAEWPQLVLTNHAEFKGGRKLEGASSFLIQHENRVIAATAKHLLGENGGVKPPVPPNSLDDSLSLWEMHPRTKEGPSVRISGLAGRNNNKGFPDWLLLTLHGERKNYPSTPLRLRKKPVTVGETIHLVGVSYQEPDRAQGVYTGKVTERNGDLFRYTIEPSVLINGFSGAPVLDKDGLVVGVMTIWFEQQADANGLNTDAGGEDASTALLMLESQKR